MQSQCEDRARRSRAGRGGAGRSGTGMAMHAGSVIAVMSLRTQAPNPLKLPYTHELAHEYRRKPNANSNTNANIRERMQWLKRCLYYAYAACGARAVNS